MADDDNQNDGDQEDREDGGDQEEERAGGVSFGDLAKLGGTILVTLIIFAALLRGCAGCQDKNPLTGEPVKKEQPAPPPPPPGG